MHRRTLLQGASALLPTLKFAADYQTIDLIRIGIVLDERDSGGPATAADFERIKGHEPSALTFTDRRFDWIPIAPNPTTVTSVDGVKMDAVPYSPFDVLSIGTATRTRSYRMDLAVGVSASRRRGEAFSTEIIIDIEGTRKNGRPGRSHHEIVHPGGEAPLTALGVVQGVEQLLGLTGGEPAKAGLYFLESLLNPDKFVCRMESIGTQITTR